MVAFLRGLFKLAMGVVAAIVGLFLLFWAVILGFVVLGGAYNALFANPSFAGRVFDGIVSYDKVIASREWFPIFGPPLNCTYAVVTLRKDAPSTPPDRDSHAPDRKTSNSWQLSFAGDWQETPVQNADHIRAAGELGHQCDPYPGDEVIAALLEATDKPGGWYHADSDTLFVYSKPAGLAFRFRFGD